MDLHAITLRQENTLYAKGAEKKEGIQVKAIAELPPILSALAEERTESIYQFFRSIAAIVKKKGTPIQLSIPASMTLMNCGILENVPANYLQKELDRLAYRLLRLEPTDPYNVDKALILPQRKSVWLTSVGVEKKYVELLWKAALQAELVLASVEIESIAAFRMSEFQKACGYMELIDNAIFISGFSPEQGMFTIQSQFNNQEDKKLELQHAIELFDTAVNEAFSQSVTSPLPILIHGQDYHRLQTYQSPSIKRLTPLTLSSMVIGKAYEAEELVDFALPLGLLLQPIFERRGRSEKIRNDKSRNK